MAARSWSVKTIDGKEADLQRQDIFRTPVAELVKDACEKMGNSYNYSLAQSQCMLEGTLRAP